MSTRNISFTVKLVAEKMYNLIRLLLLVLWVHILVTKAYDLFGTLDFTCIVNVHGLYS